MSGKVYGIQIDDATGKQEFVPIPQGGASGVQRSTIQDLQQNMRTALSRSATALDRTNTERVSVTFPVVTAAANIRVIAPVTGTLTAVRAVATAQPTTNSLTFTTSIGGVPVTNGVATILTTDAAGTIKSAAPTAANAVTANTTSVNIAINGDAGGGGTATVELEFTRAA